MAIPLRIKVSIILSLIKEPKVFKFLISQRHAGYLYTQGWFNSFKSNSPVDKNNKPIPWMTYSFIDFIKDRLNNELTVFEFGTGNSTLFFAERVKKVVAVEHNKEWYENIKKKVPGNVLLYLKNLNQEYENSISMKTKFDIIIVDGERRIESITTSIREIKDNGILILDDSEREEYKKGIECLKNVGFRLIDFWGIAPGTFFNKCTTIFYRDKNCIGI